MRLAAPLERLIEAFRKLPGIGAHDPDAPGACDVSRGIRVLERDGLPAVLLQDPGVAAARGAYIQRPAGLRQPSQLPAQYGAAFPVPPVVVFQRGQQLEFGGIHDLTSTACTENFYST